MTMVGWLQFGWVLKEKNTLSLMFSSITVKDYKGKAIIFPRLRGNRYVADSLEVFLMDFY